MSSRRLTSVLAIALLTAPVALPLLAGDFPKVSESERKVTAVGGAPNAPAVILYRKAEFDMMDPARQRMSSRLHVEARIKILTEEGQKTWSDVEIPHSRFVRLTNLEGRTVLPDGRTVPLGKDAVFERRSSTSRKTFVTSAAFPAVEVGAVLDYRYDLRFESIFYLEPWYFQSRVPTLHSEISYVVPQTLGLKVWSQLGLSGSQIHQEEKREPGGRRITYWMDRVGGIPDEPSSFPFADLSAKLMLVPAYVATGGIQYPILDDWKSVDKLIYDDSYGPALHRDRATRAKAKEILARAGSEPRARAEALYRFVRDEIETEEVPGVLIGDKSTVDATLEAQRGDLAEKALLLRRFLEIAKLDADLVWVPNRFDGRVDPALPNPDWFESVLVRTKLGKQEVYLDPSDRDLGFGYLRPENEGVRAVVFDPKDPQVVKLPMTPYDRSQRQAHLDLAVDEEGAVTGKGSLHLTGHHGWLALGRGDTPDATRDYWQGWLEDRLPAFTISDVEVDESVPKRSVEVRWAMVQKEEEVLGDEVSLQPCRPLGPVRRLFPGGTEVRRTPALVLFPDRDEVEVVVHWPEGWQVETPPAAASLAGESGTLAASVKVDAAARQLTYHRRFDITGREFTTKTAFTSLKNLYDAVEKHDAQPLVLVRR